MAGNLKMAGIFLVSFPVIMMTLAARSAHSHCDTLAGPVVLAARLALDREDVTPALKWVKKQYEGEIREAFRRTVAVRKKGPEAKDLADMYFFETLVRLHRAGEGAPFTGLKPGEDVEPIVAEADKALESGSVDGLLKRVTEEVVSGIRKRYVDMHKKKKHADESVEAGRKFVEAYVEFTHYVERLYGNATGEALHHETPAGHGPEGHDTH